MGIAMGQLYNKVHEQGKLYLRILGGDISILN